MEVLKVSITGEEKYQRLLSGPPETVRMKSGSVVLQPGESVGEHIAEAREEAIIVLEGQGEIFCEGTGNIQIEEKELVYIPRGTKHNVKNTGGVPLKYVYVVALLDG
ncbi:MAG: cupin domain-containing protein [Candidatus Tantalella remota]|nr:cupin domain-containing protein [Candidatus Tantalella remota]